MFAKIGIAGFSDLLDFAAAPIKSRRDKAEAIEAGCRKVSILTGSPEGVAVESAICAGEPGACCSSALALMQEGHRLVLEGFPLEDVAELCGKQNYRWRFGHRGDYQDFLRFVIEPSLDPDAKEV